MPNLFENLIGKVRRLPAAVKAPIAVVLISFTCLATFWPGLSGGFIFDDFPNLVRESSWRADSLAPSTLWEAAGAGQSGTLGRPLSMLSFAVNHAVSAASPFALKLTNLVLHAANAALVFLLALSIFRLLPAGRYSEPIVRWQLELALLVAVVWAIHPLQVSTVLYVVQRMEVGAHTGVLLALLSYLQARRRQMEGKPCIVWFLTALLAAAAGMLFKESAVLVFGYALMLELFLLHFRGSNQKRSSVVLGGFAAVVTLGIATYVFWFLPIYLEPFAYATRDFTLTERLYTQIDALRQYVLWSVFPEPTRYVFYYDNFPVSQGLLSPPTTLLSTAFLGAMIAVAMGVRRHMPLVSLGVAWFFVAHALTSNVVPLELVFEHRNYFSLLGLTLVAVQLGVAAGKRLHVDAGWTIALVAMVVVGMAGAMHAHTWGDSMRLSTALATRNPESTRASYDLGQRLFAASQMDSGSAAWWLARGQFEHAASLPGSSVLPEQALLFMDARAGNPSNPVTWDALRTKLSARRPGPTEIGALYALSQCAIQAACQLDVPELESTLDQVMRQHPRSVPILTMQANILINVHGNHEAAIDKLNDAILIRPDDPGLRETLRRIEESTSLDFSPEVS